VSPTVGAAPGCGTGCVGIGARSSSAARSATVNGASSDRAPLAAGRRAAASRSFVPQRVQRAVRPAISAATRSRTRHSGHWIVDIASLHVCRLQCAATAGGMMFKIRAGFLTTVTAVTDVGGGEYDGTRVAGPGRCP
jgi:hypothetical protein